MVMQRFFVFSLAFNVLLQAGSEGPSCPRKRLCEDAGKTAMPKRHSPDTPNTPIDSLSLEESSLLLKEKEKICSKFAELFKLNAGFEGIFLDERELQLLPKGYVRGMVHEMLQYNGTNADHIAVLSRNCSLEEAHDLILEAAIVRRKDILLSLKKRVEEIDGNERSEATSSTLALAKDFWEKTKVEAYTRK